jgi:protease I
VANELLQGRKVAILLAPVGTEQVEFVQPKKAVEDAGASVEVIGIQTGDAQTMNSDVNPGETSRWRRPSPTFLPMNTTP